MPTSILLGLIHCPISQISPLPNFPWVIHRPISSKELGQFQSSPKFISCFIFLCALVFMGVHLLWIVHALSNFLGGMGLLDSSITQLLQENWTKSKLLLFTHCVISLRSWGNSHSLRYTCCPHFFLAQISSNLLERNQVNFNVIFIHPLSNFLNSSLIS